jgi:muconolactone delta-isomerase
MPFFLVESDISPLNEGMARVIPKQRAYVDELFQRGVIHMYAVDEDLNKWWCTIEAESESEVLLVLSEMPIIEWLTPRVHGLMFYNSADQMIPPISLN